MTRKVKCTVNPCWDSQYPGGMPGRRGGALPAQCAPPPCPARLCTPLWRHSWARASDCSAAPRPPSAARPPLCCVSAERRVEKKRQYESFFLAAKQLTRREVSRKAFLILTIIDDGTAKATQGSLAIFTNSGPWKFCRECGKNVVLRIVDT